jgi:ribosomal protein S12 methylthiotransferase
MRIHIITLGCPKNEVDSEMMAVLLTQAGHQTVAERERADVLLVNTCGFIEPARQEAYELLDELASSKRSRQSLVVTGCLAQRRCDEICARFPVDAVVGAQAWPRIVEVVGQLERRQRRVVALTPTAANLVASVQRHATRGRTAYLKIADGCDAACAYCAIPLIKGEQRSKPAADILREARELAAEDVAELVLIAQDTTAYGRDLPSAPDLAALVRRLDAEVKGLAWQRLLYAYPNHVTPELVAAMAETPSVCHYLDVPLQHGDPDVLRRMRRPHNVQQIHDMVGALRQAMPDVVLRSTFIVGFPGETEHEFQGLLDVRTEVRFDKMGVFQFSPEEGTPAYDMPGQVAAELKQERYDRAMTLQQGISAEINAGLIGQRLEVLIEAVEDGLSVGRSYRDAPEIDGVVIIPAELEEGAFVEVEVTAADEYDLTAQPL